MRELAQRELIGKYPSIPEMRNVTIYAHVLIFCTWPFQSHVDKMQPKLYQSKRHLVLALHGLHDVTALVSLWGSSSPLSAGGHLGEFPSAMALFPSTSDNT